MAHKVEILGVRIDILTKAVAARRLVERGIDTAQPTTYVVKPYVEFFDRSRRDPAVGDLLNASWLSLPDGVSTQWAATYLAGRPGALRALALAAAIVLRPAAIRKPIPEKFGGTDFAWLMLESAAAADANVYLVGSPGGGSIEKTAAAIRARIPGLNVVGVWPGSLGGLSGRALATALREHPLEADLAVELRRIKPDLILIGMGFPLQEILAAKLAPQLKHGVIVGEGGTFDYASFGGQQPKAPRFMSRIGLEWLWRLGLQPTRIRRQLAIPRFMRAVYRSSTAGKR